ncbi:hypothetical protein N779_03110 [Vibrio coralliilyticus OCN008]|nr:hypothetical protein N779_03110 [Vibrio coralliilyticus OCN008]
MMNLEGKIALVTGASVVLVVLSLKFLLNVVRRLSALRLQKMVPLQSVNTLVKMVKVWH